MSMRSDTIQVIGREGTVNTEVDHRKYTKETKESGIFGRIKHFIGKAVKVDEDWIFKSKDWPYLWTKK